MGLTLTKDAEQSFSATVSDSRAYFAEFIRNVPKGAVVSVSSDGTCSAVMQTPADNTSYAVTDLRSLRDALVAQFAR